MSHFQGVIFCLIMLENTSACTSAYEEKQCTEDEMSVTPHIRIEIMHKQNSASCLLFQQFKLGQGHNCDLLQSCELVVEQIKTCFNLWSTLN